AATGSRTALSGSGPSARGWRSPIGAGFPRTLSTVTTPRRGADPDHGECAAGTTAAGAETGAPAAVVCTRSHAGTGFRSPRTGPAGGTAGTGRWLTHASTPADEGLASSQTIE